ncbi:hypothetical protein SLNWT_5750 [Streptomyces albus]|uniref:Uncharacterized protein n=1 Tax=Streptomyces albus (strain ATCC 21838 / DSM 41398 / FERM P-419 / JCM 4703 / NBRC 107858) TaxID=1081613 RepID=A0A0B5F5F2_STRA4|nr:hypothetical protein SLNWT_5750 [Streptomyces albus]AOU80427.1 hypothetical protein SLNHY_5736 [Streptomyces albus]AYN36139.1 hypothetical protein DUI70_5644 [Streptomyces albus]
MRRCRPWARAHPESSVETGHCWTARTLPTGMDPRVEPQARCSVHHTA